MNSIHIFDDLVEELNRAVADNDPTVRYQFSPELNYRPLLERLAKDERKIIRGKMPITREKADIIIGKINEYEKEIADYDLDEIVGELYFGQYVIPSNGFPEYRIFDAYQRSLELGRALSDKELEEFRIDFTRDKDDDE